MKFRFQNYLYERNGSKFDSLEVNKITSSLNINYLIVQIFIDYHKSSVRIREVQGTRPKISE